jgi:ATP-dependent Lhr-like helicase
LELPSHKRQRVRTWEKGGRFSILPKVADDENDAMNQWVDILLGRYGVVFRELLAKEPLAPRWGAMYRVFRERELKGEIYGGRFVAGVSGDQYASKEAAELLRECSHRKNKTSEVIILSHHDPALILVTEDQKSAVYSQGARYALRRGEVIARRNGKDFVQFTKDDLGELSYRMGLRGRFRFKVDLG